MALDPISSTPSDFNKALKNLKETGKFELTYPERWRAVIELKNQGKTNPQIAKLLNYKNHQSIANMVRDIKQYEEEHGIQLLVTRLSQNTRRREIDLVRETITAPKNDLTELATILFLVNQTAQSKLPFKSVQTRAGVTKDKFNELWSELSEAGFQEDGTLWRGMVMPKVVADRDFNGGDEVMSYLTYLSHNLDQVPSVEINVELAGEILVHAMAAIAIFQAQNKRYEVLESFKPYTVPKKHRNKENTNAALDILKHKDLIWEN